jgi:hypothetical protein
MICIATVATNSQNAEQRQCEPHDRVLSLRPDQRPRIVANPSFRSTASAMLESVALEQLQQAAIDVTYQSPALCKPPSTFDETARHESSVRVRGTEDAADANNRQFD